MSNHTIFFIDLINLELLVNYFRGFVTTSSNSINLTEVTLAVFLDLEILLVGGFRNFEDDFLIEESDLFFFFKFSIDCLTLSLG